MKIDEAIAKYKDIANTDANCPRHCMRPCDECVQECGQVAEWLEELKECKRVDKAVYSAGYKNAIDDFAERLTAYLGVENATKYGNKNAEQMRNSYDTIMNYEIADAIEDVAEQLKAGE